MIGVVEMNQCEHLKCLFTGKVSKRSNVLKRFVFRGEAGALLLDKAISDGVLIPVEMVGESWVCIDGSKPRKINLRWEIQ